MTQTAVDLEGPARLLAVLQGKDAFPADLAA